MEDWQLLQEYASGRSDSAFATLVRRHASLVHSVALRHVGNPQLAEDVAQAVFILLARKAASLRPGTVLSGWLFQTTRFVAYRAARCEQRRRGREEEAMTMHEPISANQTWQRIGPVVDDALENLSAKDRDALMVRFFEGRNLREVGAALGIGEEAAKKRVARALEKMRSILTRRGWHLSVTVLAAAMAEQASATVAAQLTAQWSANATVASVPSVATALVDQVIAAWRWTKIKWAAALGVGAVSVAILVTLAVQPGQSDSTIALAVSPPTPETDVASANVPAAIVSAPSREANPEMKLLRFRVVSAFTGEGIANARGGVTAWAGRTGDAWDLKTDAAGWCDVRYPADTRRLDVGAVADGWAARFVTWPAEGDSTFAREYTLRLETVTNVIGGWVRDSSGQPVPNAEIRFQAHGTGDSAHYERPRERFGFLHAIPATQTDANGRWFIGFVPPRHPGFQIEVVHPDFAITSVASSGAQQSMAEVKEEALQQLWIGTLVTTLNPAYSLTGTVVDEQNTPIARARIQQREQGEVFIADVSGAFRVPRLSRGPWIFTASAEGYAPKRITVEIGPETQPVVVPLQVGAVLRVRVVDEDGNGVPNATVGMDQWGEHRNALEWKKRTDSDGRLEWRSAPGEVELNLYAHVSDFCWTRDVIVKADDEEHLIRLRRTLKVYGRVTDAQHGFGIPDFRVVPNYGKQYGDAGLAWFGGETIRGTNGLFEFKFTENSLPWRVRVVAEGYADWTSEPMTNGRRVNLDIPLQRSALERSVHGLVLGPAGTPAVGAQVALLSLEHDVRLRNGKFAGENRWLLRADEKGEFRFAENPLAHSVAAVSSEGYAHVRVRQTAEPVTLQLQPWGRVEGVVQESARAHPLSTIELYDPAADNYGGRVSLLGNYRVKPDENARFVFESVPPGEFSLFINSGLGIPYHHQTPIVVRAGETIQAQIVARKGTLIRGRLVVPADKAVNWSKDRIVAHMEIEALRFAPGWSSKDEGTLLAVNYWTSRAGREYVNTWRMASLRVADDGSFVSVERVPAGEYVFRAVFKNASVHRKVTVASADEQLPHLDLGVIELR